MLNSIDLTDLFGKPFDLNGTGPDAYNCYNLCREVCRRAGVFLPEKQPFEDLAKRHELIENSKYDCIELAKPEPYCLVTFKMVPKYVTHVGVVLEDTNYFIHIMRNSSVCVARLDNIVFRKKIDGFFKYVGC